MTPLMEFQLVASSLITLVGGSVVFFVLSPLLPKRLVVPCFRLSGFMALCAILEMVGLIIVGAFWYIWSA